MSADESRLVHTSGQDPSNPLPCQQVHHSQFPEVRGQGGTIVEAAEHLLNLLLRAQSSVGSAWRRSHIDRVLDDVREFLTQHRQAEKKGEPPLEPATSATRH